MLIRLGYDIELQLFTPTTVIAVLNVHPSRVPDLREPDEIRVSPAVEQDKYLDSFGNICTRIAAPAGPLRLRNNTLIEDSGEPDAVNWDAPVLPTEKLPADTVQFLLASRYCEVDRSPNLHGRCSGTFPPAGPERRPSATGCTTM